MQKTTQVVYENMEGSPAIEERIRQRVAKLEQFFDGIIGCRVVVESPHRHQHKGKIYQTRITVTVPGNELVVNRSPGEDHAHEDAYVAIRDSFDAMERKLADHSRRIRGEVKVHEAPPHGRITEIYPHMDYGRIISADGRDIYFHRNAIMETPFEKLEIGTQVWFAEELGDEGPKATTVHVVGKHHHVS